MQLLRDPRVLLLDEPTAGLDWSVRDEVLELLGELSRDRVLLVVTHEPELFAGRVEAGHSWRLEQGQLVGAPGLELRQRLILGAPTLNSGCASAEYSAVTTRA